MIKNKKAQEALVGFALIVIIVSIVILSILFFAFRDKNEKAIESYEVSSFIQSSLQYTTKCENSFGNVSIKKIITDMCAYDQRCQNGASSCDVLRDTIKAMINSGFQIGNGSAVKGYSFIIWEGENEMISLKEGNETKSYKGSSQDFSRGSSLLKIYFKLYY